MRCKEQKQNVVAVFIAKFCMCKSLFLFKPDGSKIALIFNMYRMKIFVIVKFQITPINQ